MPATPKLSPAELDVLLERYDQTAPALQRGIVGELMMRLQTLAGERDALQAALDGMAVADTVLLQRLSDYGLNPFALSLLRESWERHPRPGPVSFVVRGVRLTLCPEKKDGES